MPCNDVTEMMRIAFDSEDRLKSYRLVKKSCGCAVGNESLLLNKLQGMKTSEISALNADEICPVDGKHNDTEKFLRLKHFFALKSVLETLNGKEPGGDPNIACTIAEISYGDDGLVVDADIAVNIVTEMIKACDQYNGKM